MTSEPQDIIGIVRELQDKWVVPNQLSYTYIETMSKIYREFPEIAQALLIAMEALEKETMKAKETNCMNCTCGMDAEKALSRIRSL